jgi:hypothetical protein
MLDGKQGRTDQRAEWTSSKRELETYGKTRADENLRKELSCVSNGGANSRSSQGETTKRETRERWSNAEPKHD